MTCVAPARLQPKVVVHRLTEILLAAEHLIATREDEMKSARELVAQAKSRVETVIAQDALTLLNDSDTAFVDLRDSSELLREGKIPGGACLSRLRTSVLRPRCGSFGRTPECTPPLKKKATGTKRRVSNEHYLFVE